MNYNIRLPNGATTEREIPQDEAEYWISIGMFLAHGFHQLTTVFQAEMMDSEATVQQEDDEEKGPTFN